MKKTLLIFAMLILPLSSYAQDAFYVSGMLGLTSVSGTDPITLDTELSIGVRAGLLFNDHVSAGIFINRYASDLTVAGSKVDVSLVNIMGEVTYYFNEADENGFWLSGLLGVTQTKGSATVLAADTTDTAFGGSIGYNFIVAPNFSIGPQFTAIKTTDDGDATEFSGIVNLTFWM
jgi:hypothetical protein